MDVPPRGGPVLTGHHVHCWWLIQVVLQTAAWTRRSGGGQWTLLWMFHHCIFHVAATFWILFQLILFVTSWPAERRVAAPAQSGCSASSRRPAQRLWGRSWCTSRAADTSASTAGPVLRCSSSASSTAHRGFKQKWVTFTASVISESSVLTTYM